MADYTSGIYNTIAAEKDNQASLATLTPANDNAASLLSVVNSKSKAARWRMFAFLVAFAHNIQRNLFDVFKSEVQAIADAAAPGTDEWYIKQALAFQYGYSLQKINGVWTYATTDVSAQVVKLAAITDDGTGGSVLKLANIVSGVKSALTSTQLASFNSYLNKYRFAGSKIIAQSLAADLLNLQYDAYYDGTLDPTTVLNNLISATENYLDNIPFNTDDHVALNGIFNVNDFIEFLKKNVAGIKDIYLTTFDAKPDGGSYGPVTREYQSSAGYMEIDPAFPLNTGINLIPQ